MHCASKNLLYNLRTEIERAHTHRGIQLTLRTLSCKFGDIHYFKVGSRLDLPCFGADPENYTSKWFIGAETGLTILASVSVVEWAASIGFEY